MFQQMTEIALRGFAYVMQQPKGDVIQSQRIGEKLGISGTYVAKAFQPLARAGWLRSVKGRAGGWVLECDPAQHTVLDAVDVLEPRDGWRRCPVGHLECGDEVDCPFHDTWENTMNEFRRVMESTNLVRLPGWLPPCYEKGVTESTLGVEQNSG